MKAVVQVDYGSADVLEFKEIDKPVANDDDVLVRVQAASLGAGDYFGMRGMPFPIRCTSGSPSRSRTMSWGSIWRGASRRSART
jgi:NADPH:quinone reductase-like Zn-dependent oxidoreductase